MSVQPGSKATVSGVDGKALPTEPRARVEYLRDFLAVLPDERFDMYDFFVAGGFATSPAEPAATFLKGCGTAACVAGWTVALFCPEKVARVDTAAEDALGLEPANAEELFTPSDYFTREGRRRYTRKAAVAVLDRYLLDGVIDWEAAIAKTGGAS